MFTQGQAIDFVEQCFGKAALTNNGLNASVICPKCAEKEDNLTKKKLVVRTDDFLTHCWVCGYRSTNLMDLLSAYHPHLIEEYRDRFNIKQTYKRCLTFDVSNLFDEGPSLLASKPAIVKLPTGFTMIASNLGTGNKPVNDAWKYLQSRGVTESELWYWKFGITDYKPKPDEQNLRFRVIVPSFDEEGNLNYFSARSYWKNLKGAKYSNPDVPRESIIFNEMNIDWKQELTIVEGVFDLIKCNENATCLLGSSMDKTYALFQKVVKEETPVLLAFDNDAHKKALKTALLFAEYGVQVRMFKVPETNHDVGELTRSRFISECQHATTFTSADYLRYRIGSL